MDTHTHTYTHARVHMHARPCKRPALTAAPANSPGDSGGPLTFNTLEPGDPIYKGAAANDRLAGVVSVGDGCGKRRTPGMYTNIANYLDWIQCEIGKAVSKLPYNLEGGSRALSNNLGGGGGAPQLNRVNTTGVDKAVSWQGVALFLK